MGNKGNKGICCICEREYKVTAKGTVARHGHKNVAGLSGQAGCIGSKLPVAATVKAYDWVAEVSETAFGAAAKSRARLLQSAAGRWL